MKKIFAVFLFLLSVCSLAFAEEKEEYDISGLWNISGTGFAEKSFVRSSLVLTGDLNIQVQSVYEISNDITNLISGEEEINFLVHSSDSLSSDLKAITSYDINLKVTATELDIKAWEGRIENGIKIPVLLPEMRPSNNNPYVLPAVSYDGLTYQVTFTSTTSGTVSIKGYIDLDVVGNTELNSICAIWKKGTEEPEDSKNGSSGCNFGFNYLCLAVMILGGFKFVRN